MRGHGRLLIGGALRSKVCGCVLIHVCLDGHLGGYMSGCLPLT